MMTFAQERNLNLPDFFHRLFSQLHTYLCLLVFLVFLVIQITLTGGIFETGAYGVPSKSQNATVLGQGGPCSNPSWVCRWHHPFGTKKLPSFSTQY